MVLFLWWTLIRFPEKAYWFPLIYEHIKIPISQISQMTYTISIKKNQKQLSNALIVHSYGEILNNNKKMPGAGSRLKTAE